MSGTARRRRERQKASPAIQSQSAPGHAPVPPPLPEWRWRTLPVFFALSGGLFFGCWIGVLVGLADAEGLAFWIPLAFALPFSFALARVSTRFMLEQKWIKPRTKR